MVLDIKGYRLTKNMCINWWLSKYANYLKLLKFTIKKEVLTNIKFFLTIFLTNNPLSKQVKNFGRSGRTKYTHLVDQDTTSFDSPWALGSASTSVAVKGKPRKQEFKRPSANKQELIWMFKCEVVRTIVKILFLRI